jgi:PIN domain nuclease of toxin-antitoxin system
MRLLLDTQAFLWWVFADERLSPTARALIGDDANECWVSLVSAWEMAIKSSLGKLQISEPVADFFAVECRNNHFRVLEIGLAHIGLVEKLPFYHRDPFDRLLIAQAQTEKLAVVSSDKLFDAYGLHRVWD